MNFYSPETYYGQVIAMLPALLSILLYFGYKRPKYAFALLLLSGFALRWIAISLDPYLHEWDERFHALVAKRMMENPLLPMLRVDDFLDYNYKAWNNNTIWLHKQPLFLWQMALSMKLFGINEFALRLPLLLMGTGMIFFVRRIVAYWTENRDIGFIAAFLFALSYYHLLVTTCRMGMDHNDISFSFYVTGSIWALTHYLDKRSLSWALGIGLFVGAAVLNKWLTGLLVYAGWGLFVLWNASERKKWTNYWHGALSLLTALIIFLPWQLYISYRFPLESAYEYAFNAKHIFEVVEGHKGDFFFYFNAIDDYYGGFFIPFLILGNLACIFRKKYWKRNLVFMSMAWVLYLFFSLAASKLVGYTMPAMSLVYGFIAIGIVEAAQVLIKFFPMLMKFRVLFIFAGLSVLGYHSLRPSLLAKESSIQNEARNARIHDAAVFRNLDKEIVKNYPVIANCGAYQDILLMFYQPVVAFAWAPNEALIAKVLQKGQKIAVFKAHGVYGLPPHLLENQEIFIINKDLKVNY